MKYFFDLDAVPKKQLLEGVSLQAVSGEHIMLSFVDLNAGAVVPMHTHEHEQMGYVMSGEIEFTIDEETKICRAGDTYLAPANVAHGVRVLSEKPARVLDVFHPPREEYK